MALISFGMLEFGGEILFLLFILAGVIVCLRRVLNEIYIVFLNCKCNKN